MRELLDPHRPALLRPWTWGTALHVAAVDNARAAATELCRRRVEREEVAAYVREVTATSRGTRRPA